MKNIISPHVTIYKFPITALTSITTRVTGVAFSGMYVFTGLNCYTNIDIKKIYNEQNFFIKKMINYSVLFPINFHTLGGIRHFIWDKNPKLLKNISVNNASYLLIFSSIGFTYISEKLL